MTIVKGIAGLLFLGVVFAFLIIANPKKVCRTNTDTFEVLEEDVMECDEIRFGDTAVHKEG